MSANNRPRALPVGLPMFLDETSQRIPRYVAFGQKSGVGSSIFERTVVSSAERRADETACFISVVWGNDNLAIVTRRCGPSAPHGAASLDAV